MRRSLLLLLIAATAAAAPATFRSGPGRTHLIELYSSEGCSSCPPAEEWLGGLREHPGLWRGFVPVAFHVDYWDRLGWRDRFASAAFASRQRAYADAWRNRQIYTPEFVLDGEEWRPRRLPPAVGDAAAGALGVEVAADGKCSISFRAAGTRDKDARFTAWVALLGGGVSSEVKAGENRGRMLHHDFLALGLASGALRDGAATIRLPKSDADGVSRRAVAVWITRDGSPAPLQAAGGWLD